VREFERVLAARTDLLVPRVVLCRQVRSFGDFQPIEPPTFTAGHDHQVIVYTEVANFHSEETDEQRFRTALSLRVEILRPDGERAWQKEAQTIEDLCRNRRQDFFLAQIIRLPATLEAEDYFLRVIVEDQLAQKVASHTIPFACQPEAQVSARHP
jgi:hypothetical protein